MSINRRTFLSRGACFGGAAFFGLPSLAAGEQAGTPKLVVGIASDIHITNPGSESTFLEILAYFRARNVDAVMLPGDLTDHGILDEMARVRAAWDKVFPDGCAADGRPVAKLFTSGNHEFEGAKYFGIPKDPVLARQAEAARADPLGNEKRVWEEAWGEKYERLRTWTVKGYTFVGAHFEGYGGAAKLDEYLKSLDLPKDRPFFYFEHMQPSCTAGWYGKKPDFNGKNTRPVLNHYPNVVALCGHTHDPLTSEQQIWQGEFLSVNCSSAKFIGPPGGRENSFAHKGTPAFKAAQMPHIDMWGMRHALVLNVFDDRLVFERREFAKCKGARLAADWVVPLAGAKAYDFESRAKRNLAGSFPSGAALAFSGWKTGKNRAGEATEQLTVSFPRAAAPEGYRVFDYAVRALAADGSVKCRKLVYNPHGFLDAAHEDATVPCVFSRAELGEGALKFEVRARDSFGNESAPIVGTIS